MSKVCWKVGGAYNHAIFLFLYVSEGNPVYTGVYYTLCYVVFSWTDYLLRGEESLLPSSKKTKDLSLNSKYFWTLVEFLWQNKHNFLTKIHVFSLIVYFYIMSMIQKIDVKQFMFAILERFQ